MVLLNLEQIIVLPEKQRTIVQLRDIEGKSYKEIADVLQLTEEQVKVNLFRARQRIKIYTPHSFVINMTQII